MIFDSLLFCHFKISNTSTLQQTQVRHVLEEDEEEEEEEEEEEVDELDEQGLEENDEEKQEEEKKKIPEIPGMCTICLDSCVEESSEEEKEDDDVTITHRLPCGHMFHSKCIVPWINEWGSCPICRKDAICFKIGIPDTNLFKACKKGDLDAAERAMEQFKEETSVSRETYMSLGCGRKGLTALHVATKFGHETVVTWLLECGASPCVRDFHRRPSIRLAKNKNVRIGVEFESGVRGCTHIIYSCQQDHQHSNNHAQITGSKLLSSISCPIS